MKNSNYNLLKMMHNALDMVWRIEQHYQKDTEGAPEGYAEVLEEVRADNQKHVDKLMGMVSKACEEEAK